MKKLVLHILIVSLTWLPVQVTFAVSVVNPEKDVISLSAAAEQTNHCDMSSSAQELTDNCCADNMDGGCSHMEHDCHQSISFVAMTQNYLSNNFLLSTVQRTIFNQNLNSIPSLSAYRPPQIV